MIGFILALVLVYGFSILSDYASDVVWRTVSRNFRTWPPHSST